MTRPGRREPPSGYLFLSVPAVSSWKKFSLEEDGYADHADWKRDWQGERRSSVYVLGSHDKTGGNPSC
ncbi:hypothetical protein MPNT_190016 [Candidatus Methylacidithermus pantelleriae]|uniref:Uncharacterized protein n=1 Tax=Candidatus Methylacidithermus pantelleriae TaxID=2744239 RepID=A0A8J2BN70_9BACT|nr:hypothetical protein MPNT_190016 [Candidatus Methylacidithermus pantelleriae]